MPSIRNSYRPGEVSRVYAATQPRPVLVPVEAPAASEKPRGVKRVCEATGCDNVFYVATENAVKRYCTSVCGTRSIAERGPAEYTFKKCGNPSCDNQVRNSKRANRQRHFCSADCSNAARVAEGRTLSDDEIMAAIPAQGAKASEICKKLGYDDQPRLTRWLQSLYRQRKIVKLAAAHGTPTIWGRV